MKTKTTLSRFYPLRSVLLAASLLLTGAAHGVEYAPLIYGTDFTGANGTQPEGWNLQTTSTTISIQDNDYRADRTTHSPYTYFTSYDAFPPDVTDYVIETRARYSIAPDSDPDRSVIISAVGRATSKSDFYSADFWVENSWDVDGGGRFRLFRFGGEGNEQLALTTGFLKPTPTGIPFPLEMTVTIRLSLIGDQISATLLDEQGNVLAYLSVQDSNHTTGTPGMRPRLGYGIINYEYYRVYEPFDIAPEPVPAEDLRIHQALELEYATQLGRLYELQQMEDGIWNSLGSGFAGSGNPAGQLLSLRGTAAADFRVTESGDISAEPALIETEFDGAAFTQPEHFSMIAGSEAFFTLDNGQYVADYRFGAESEIFLAVLDGPGDPVAWTDYMVEAEISYSVDPFAVEGAYTYPGLVARAWKTGPGQYYMAQFMPQSDWEPLNEDGTSVEGNGGRFRIYRIGGGGSEELAAASGFLQGSGPPSDMTVTMRLVVVGSGLTATLFDEFGAVLAQVTAEDTSHPNGGTGVRPTMVDGIVRYDSFRVVDLTNLDYVEAPSTAAPASEITFRAPAGFDYQIQRSEDLMTWENIDAQITGANQEVSHLFSTKESERIFYRAETID